MRVCTADSVDLGRLGIRGRERKGRGKGEEGEGKGRCTKPLELTPLWESYLVVDWYKYGRQAMELSKVDVLFVVCGISYVR